jgi:hypothetical protein
MQNTLKKGRTYPPRVVISNTHTPQIDKQKYLQTISDLGGSPEGLQDFMNTKITEAVQVVGGQAGAIGRQTIRDFWNSESRVTNHWLVILELYKLNLINQIQR